MLYSALESQPTSLMRLLCTGDLHIGRRSSRVPADLPDASAADAWARIVTHAIHQRADAVLLSGDVVDQDNRYFEALGPLERGLFRLREAGIPVVAVAGNHDFDVLPALARSLPDGLLHLLGVGGMWERHTIENARGERVHVDGWSFPARVVRHDPLTQYVAPAIDGAPVLGLVHGDLNVPQSLYAPLSLASLRRVSVNAWVLGHVHSGGLMHQTGDAPVLYPGSPQPLDPGEPGAHGVWMLTVTADGTVAARLDGIATVRYEPVFVDLSTCATETEARECTTFALRARLLDILTRSPELRHVALRVCLSGRTPLHGQLQPLVSLVREISDLGLAFSSGANATLSVTHVELATTAERDLTQLSASNDPIGVLARLLLTLQHGDAIDPALAQRLRPIPARVREARVFAGAVHTESLSDDAVRRTLSAQADRLLETLLRQRDQSP